MVGGVLHGIKCRTIFASQSGGRALQCHYQAADAIVLPDLQHCCGCPITPEHRTAYDKALCLHVVKATDQPAELE